MTPIEKLIDAAKDVVSESNNPGCGIWRQIQILNNAISAIQSSPPTQCKWGLEEISIPNAIDYDHKTTYFDQNLNKVFMYFYPDETYTWKHYFSNEFASPSKLFRLVSLPATDEKPVDEDLITIGNGVKVKPGTTGLWKAFSSGFVERLNGAVEYYTEFDRIFPTESEAEDKLTSEGWVKIADGWVKRDSDTEVTSIDDRYKLYTRKAIYFAFDSIHGPSHYFLSRNNAESFLADKMKKQGKFLTADGVWVDGDAILYIVHPRGISTHSKKAKELWPSVLEQSYSCKKAAADAWLRLVESSRKGTSIPDSYAKNANTKGGAK